MKMEEKEGEIEHYLFGALKIYFWVIDYVHYNDMQYLRENCCKSVFDTHKYI